MIRMMFIFLIALCAFGNVHGQQQSAVPDDCLMGCMNDMYRSAPRMDAMKVLNIIPVQIGNETAMCPKLNDTAKLDQDCRPMIQLKNCTNACPDTQVKKISMSAFKGMQFLCVDRNNDVKQYMPCLSEKCPEIQQACVPKCGSIESASMKIVSIMHQVRGGSGGQGPPAGAAPAAPGFSPSPAGHDVDMSQIMKVMGDTCTTMSCFIECSEPLTTKLCGKEGYLLQRDFIWTMFTQVAQSMSSMGLQTQWPQQCQVLASTAQNATGPIPAEASASQAPSGTTVPTQPEGTVPSGNATAGNVTQTTPSGATVETGASKQCEKPPCQGCMGMVPSTILLAVTSMAILIFKAV